MLHLSSSCPSETNITCATRKDRFQSHSRELTLSGGQTQTLDVQQACLTDDCWTVNGDWILSGHWTDVTQFTFFLPPPKGYNWSGERDKDPSDVQAREKRGQIVRSGSQKKSQQKAKYSGQKDKAKARRCAEAERNVLCQPGRRRNQ